MSPASFDFRLPLLAAGLTALLAVLVLSGWILGVPALTTFVADGPPIPIPTAILLLLASVILGLLHQRRWPPVAAALGAMVLLLGVAALMETELGVRSGLQEGVSRLFLAVPGEGGARILPHAVLAFNLLGGALLLSAGEGARRAYLAQGLALAVAALGVQATIGVFFRLGTLPAGDMAPGMALPAAWSFLLLGAGILFLHPGQGLAAILLSKGPGGALLRFIVPVVLLVPNGLVLLAMAGMGFDHYGERPVLAVLALIWVAVVMGMFFALGVYLNRKGEELAGSERRYRAVADELKLTSQLMERIFSNIHVLVAYLDTGFNFIRVNENYAANDRRTPGFFTGRNHFDLYPNAENEAIFRRVLESGEPYVAYARPFEYPDQPGRGVTYWDWNLTPVKGEGDRVEGLLLTLAEVTARVRAEIERQRAEAALRQSEETARTLLNASSETAMLVDRDGVVLAVNAVGASRMRRTPEQLVGQCFFDLVPAEVSRRRQPLIHSVFDTGQPADLRDERDGMVFDSMVHPVCDAAGKVVAAAIYATDITARVRQQALDTLFNEIDQQVLRGLPLSGLLEFICAEVARLLNYQFVWIGRRETGGEISIAASAGPEQDYRFELERIGVRWDDTPQGHSPAGLSIRLGQTQVFRCSDPGFRPWQEASDRFGLKAIIGIPLIIRGEVYGAFTLYSQQEEAFDDPVTTQHLNMIAGRICVALEMAMDQQQLRLLGTALASAGNGVFITDRRGRIQWMNPSFSRLTGYAARDAMGETPRLFKSGRQGPDYYQTLWQTILQGKVWCNETVEKRKDGSEFTVLQTITPIRGAEGEVTHFISILEDITVQKANEARIEHLAHYDALTDLPNRPLFYDRLTQLVAQARRGMHSTALMFLDLDRFKAVNDTYGHHVGDLLLQEVARRIRACVRETDTVARLSGDEFTVLLPQVADRESAAVVARKVIATLGEPFLLDSREVCISTSIGIALYPQDTDDCDRLVKYADHAMYEAKQRGRNNYCFFDASSASL